MMNQSKDQSVNINKRTMFIATAMIYLFGFSGGLFLYPFIGYQGLVAFGALVLGVLLIIVTVYLQRN